MKNIITISLLTICYASFGKVLPSLSEGLGSGWSNPALENSICTLIFTPELDGPFTDRQVENFVMLGIDYGNPNYYSNSNVIVGLEISYYNISGALIGSPHLVDLAISYANDGSMITDRSIYTTEGAYKIVFEITSISVNAASVTALPGNMYIKSQIVVERFFNFDTAAGEIIDPTEVTLNLEDIDCEQDGVYDFINVTWPEVKEAEEYDLEWLFINDYGTTSGTFLSTSNLQANFKFNSTRVTTTSTSFSIPNIFDHGYLLVRIRANGREYTDFETPIFGLWNVLNSGTVEDLINEDCPYLLISSPHEPMLNWQVTSTFAEEGKHKEVISYFDGSLRNRQTVTRLSTSGVAVVGESIYDFHGRPAIQILPSPVLDENCEFGQISSIKFYKKFNKVAGQNKAYDAYDFDLDSESSCKVNTKGLNTSSGAGMYYSSANPEQSNENSYIPNSALSVNGLTQAYPFTQVEYTPDNTGRIQRQSGVGYDFQLNSDHESIYYYGMPHQIQLDRLFGSEAGYFQHYKKNMVIDPNGQVSISYLDMADRVIATALAGAEPENLSPIESLPSESTELNSYLINSESSNTGANLINDESITFQYQLLVPEASDYTFNYDIEVDKLTVDCSSICMHCIYDLTISVTNDCGEIVWPTENMPMTKKVGQFHAVENGPIEFVTLCDEGNPFEFEQSFILSNLPAGEYTVVKNLTIDSEARDFFINEFMSHLNESCLETEESMIDDFLAEVDYDDCAIEFGCTECLANLGDRDVFIATGPYDFETNSMIFDWRFDECQKICTPTSLCLSGYNMMLADVSKGGQYGQYEVLALTGNFIVNPLIHHVSVFNENNYLPLNDGVSAGNWRFPSLELNGTIYNYYFNDDGTRSKIPVLWNGITAFPSVLDNLLIFDDGSGGHFTYPENLSDVEDFLGFWEMSWAKSLVIYHPEYCYYKSCIEYNERQSLLDYITSDQFDALLESINTMADAEQFGLVDIDHQPTDWFTRNPSDTWPFSTDENDKPYDPFVLNGDEAGEIFSGDGTPYYYGLELKDRYTSLDGGTAPFGMVALAAFSVLSSVEPSHPVIYSPTSAALEAIFGTNIGEASDYITNQNSMWIALKNTYLGIKRQLQNERNNHYAIHDCAGYNGCFSENSLGEYADEFLTTSDEEIFDIQPCNPSTRFFYANKTARYASVAQSIPDLPQLIQCPKEGNLQNLFNKLIELDEFTSTNVDLSTIQQYASVFTEISHQYDPAYDLNVTWNANIVGNTLEIEWINDIPETICNLIIDGDGQLSSSDWANIFFIGDLRFDALGSFTATVWYTESGNSEHVQVTGSFDCEMECEQVEEVPDCNPNLLAHDLIQFMNAVINSTNPYCSLSNVPSTHMYLFADYLTPAIMAQFPGASLEDLDWNFNVGSGSSYYGGYFQMISSVDGSEFVLFVQFIGIGGTGIVNSIAEILEFNCRDMLPVAPNSPAVSLKVRMNNGIITKLYSSIIETVERSLFCNCIDEPQICCQGIGYSERYHVEAFVEEFISEIWVQDGEIMGSINTPQSFSSLLMSYLFSDSPTDNNIVHGSYYDDQLDEYVNAEILTIEGNGCDLSITMYPVPDGSTSFVMPLFLSIDAVNFELIGPMDDAGFQYQFKFTYDEYTFVGSWCIPMKQCEYYPPCGGITGFPNWPTIIPSDPCVALLDSVAINNGIASYNEWYNNFVQDLEEAYNNHCLNNVIENLSVKFEDREHHYTLYYYDQAGNLVRTVPPAGVIPLDINSSTDLLALNVDQDRVTGQQRITMFHNLTTTYHYNSLNQLVHQSIPDHDKMDVWETTLPNGIINEFEANEIQYTSSSHAFIGGQALISSTSLPSSAFDRGIAYKSFDSGNMWQRMDGMVASDILKIEMLNAFIGYAVGKNGVVLKTIDGGKNWDMLSVYAAFNNQVPGNLNDIAFNVNQGSNLSGGNTGSIAALIIGDKGMLIRMRYHSSGREIFERIVPSVINSTEAGSIIPSFGVDWDFKSVEIGNGRFNIMVNFPGGFQNEGFCLPFSMNGYNTNNNPNFSIPPFASFNITQFQLTCEEFIRPSDYKAVHRYAQNSAFAAGPEGRLFHCDNLNEGGGAYAQWFQVPTNNNYEFQKIHFYDIKHGVALINEGTVSAPINAIYTTTDHGRSWKKLSQGNDSFNDLYFYQKDPVCTGSSDPLFVGMRIFAVGNGGKVARVALVVDDSNSSFGMEYIASPTTSDLNTCWAEVVKDCNSNTDFLVRYVVAGDAGTIYTALTYGHSNNPHWQTIISGISNDIVDVEINAGLTGRPYPLFNGVLLDHLGAVYSFYIDEGDPICSGTGSDSDCNSSVLCPNHCPSDYIIAPYIGLPTTPPVFSQLIRIQGSNTADDIVFALNQTQPTSSTWAYDLFKFNLSNLVVAPIDMTVADASTNDDFKFVAGSGWVDGSNSEITLVGINGFNFSIEASNSTSGTTTNWINDDRYAIRPLHNIDEEFSSNQHVFLYTPLNTNQLAVGRDGTILARRRASSNTGGIANSWSLLNTGINEDITALDYYRDDSGGKSYGMLGTAQGKVFRWTRDGAGANPSSPIVHPGSTEPLVKLDLVLINSSSSERINGIASNYNSPFDQRSVCLVGNNGLVMRASIVSNSPPYFNSSSIMVLAQGDVDYFASASLPAKSEVIIGGEDGRFENCFYQTHVKNDNVFLPRITDLNFINPSEGYVVAEGFTLRHTIDGGQTWNVVLPSVALGSTLPELNKVCMKASGNAYAVGRIDVNSSPTMDDFRPYIIKLENNVSSIETLTGISNVTNSNLVDMRFDAYNTPYIVGRSNGNASIFYRTNDTGSWTQVNDTGPGSNAEYRGLHIFPSNNSVIVCGYKVVSSIENPVVNIFSNGSWDNHSDFGFTGTGYRLNDIFFHDDLVGYVVGTNGALHKTKRDMPLPEYDTNGLLDVIEELEWEPSNINPNTYNSQSSPTSINLNSIAFSNRWEGCWGGNYIGSGIARGHVRLIRDESEIYSTRFYYDRLGRIVASQNTKQYNSPVRKYSYTLYDRLGRVTEAGEKRENETGQQFAGIFGIVVEGYYNSILIDDDRLNNWIIGDGARKEVTKTYYDENPITPSTLPSNFNYQESLLRKRVACVTYENTFDNDIQTYDHATHYAYDIHGNVNTLLQDFPAMGIIEADERFKRMDYWYDLISGNVKQVSFQTGKPDQFYHYYLYDADNRITDVFTSRMGWDAGSTALLNTKMPGDILPYFERDASYNYYLHGPLSRIDLGDIAVQGIDYAYTLQGWLKGVNSNTLKSSRDIGMDGELGSYNEQVGRDAFGFTLGYYLGDYTPIGATNHWNTVSDRFEAQLDGADNLLGARSNLYNGNIGHMVTALYSPPGAPASGASTSGVNLINGMAYQYDQLNRLVNAEGYQNIDVNNNTWQTTNAYVAHYKNTFTYDGNGNILTQLRSNEGNQLFEDLEYKYELDEDNLPIRNRLYHVLDADVVNNALYTDDIESQGAYDGDGLVINSVNNYGYDEIGQLIRDNYEKITEISWRVDGKISYISRDNSSTNKELGFSYDAMGNRIAKYIYSSSGTLEKSIFYIRDASGNVMSVYENIAEGITNILTQTELHIYGSSRLGLLNLIDNELIDVPDPTDVGEFELERGRKSYELCNHLGNVLSIVADNKIPISDDLITIDYFRAVVISYTDYYPFGAPMAERSWQGDYRYGFNGKEKDHEGMGGGSQTYDFGFRIYNPAIAKFLSVDPLLKEYPMISTYQFASNSPIWCIDIDGLEGGTASNYRIITNVEMTQELFIGDRQKDQYGFTNSHEPSSGSNENSRGQNVKVEWWYAGDYSKPNGKGIWMWRENETTKRIDPKGITLFEVNLERPKLKMPKALPTPATRVIGPVPIKAKKPIVHAPTVSVVSPPKPKVVNLSLNLAFNGNRFSFSKDPTSELTPILTILLQSPTATLNVSPKTEYSENYDIIDFWGLSADADTSNELVEGRANSIKKWFTDRGVNPSQIISNTSNSYNQSPSVSGTLTTFE